MTQIVVLDPSAEPRATRRALAARSGALAGKRIGFLSNRKANADLLLERVRALLRERWRGFESVWEEKAAPLAAPKEVLERLVRCDAVVTAIAD